MWDIDMTRLPGDRIREIPDDRGGTIRYRPSAPVYSPADQPTQALPAVQPAAQTAVVSPLLAGADTPSEVLAVVADELAAAEDGARRWAQALADMRLGLVVLHRDALTRLAQITGT